MALRARKKEAGAIPRNFIREWREAEGWTLLELLDHLAPLHVRMTEGNLSKMERSKTPVDTGTLHAMAVVFKTSPIALMLGPPGDPLVMAIDALGPLDKEDRADAVASLLSMLRLAKRAG
jgi:transcriptional regulator with XRE-family HTH domain